MASHSLPGSKGTGAAPASNPGELDWNRMLALGEIELIEQHIRSGIDWIESSRAAGVSPLALARIGVDVDLMLRALIRAGEERARAAEGEALRQFRHASKGLFALEAAPGEALPAGPFQYPAPSRAAVHLLCALDELLRARRAAPPRVGVEWLDDFASLVRDLDVVEIGCGHGRLMALLEGVGARCVGFDPAPLPALDPRLCIHARSAAELAHVLPPASVDLVLSNNTLCQAVMDRDHALASVLAAERCLRPGGLQLHAVWMQPLLPGHAELLEWRALRAESDDAALVEAALEILCETGRCSYVNEPVLTDRDLAGMQLSRVLCHRIRDHALIIAIERCA